MSEWQSGDLALCIKQGEWRHSVTGQLAQSRGMAAGVIATVRKVGVSSIGILTLWFDGWPGEKFEDGYGACRFRRIPPHFPDREDIETIRLLNGERVGEPA